MCKINQIDSKRCTHTHSHHDELHRSPKLKQTTLSMISKGSTDVKWRAAALSVSFGALRNVGSLGSLAPKFFRVEKKSLRPRSV